MVPRQQMMSQNMQVNSEQQIGQNYCYSQGMDNHSFSSNMQHKHGKNWTNRTTGIMQNQLCLQMSITHPNNHHNICSQTHQYMNQCNKTEMSSTNNFNMAMRVQENMNPCANHYSLMCNQNAQYNLRHPNGTCYPYCGHGAN
ncbi:hypothetical protein WA026_019285 [Henosepilachna vigintioctopunctata]|uniref:Uncharacterized protein n=1 Tax=Henosepilachna vigintioctopunctata TaxID=420089 RepID=A0AAW1U563_9CUCU